MVRFSPAMSLAKVGINAVKGAPKASARIADAIPQSKSELIQAGRNIKTLPKKMATSSIIDRKPIDGEVRKTAGNVWTGKKINPIHLGLAGGAYLAGDAMLSGSQMNSKKPLELATMNNYQNYGAADVMSYDGVSQQRAPQNLNATGDIVFGLHNGRKG